MSQLTDKIKEQFDGVSKQVVRLEAAGRGLILRLSQEGGRQIEELAKEGETQLESGNGFAAQLKDAVKFDGTAKEFAGRVKLAAFGLLEKAKSGSQKIMDDLVKEVEAKEKPKAARPKPVKKSAKTAQAA